MSVEIHHQDKWHKVNFTVRPCADGLDLLRRDGTVFVRWNLEWQGPFLRLSHRLHTFSSWLRLGGNFQIARDGGSVQNQNYPA